MPGWTKWDPGGANRRQSVVLKFGFEDLFKTYCCVSDTHTHTLRQPSTTASGPRSPVAAADVQVGLRPARS